MSEEGRVTGRHYRWPSGAWEPVLEWIDPLPKDWVTP